MGFVARMHRSEAKTDGLEYCHIHLCSQAASCPKKGPGDFVGLLIHPELVSKLLLRRQLHQHYGCRPPHNYSCKVLAERRRTSCTCSLPLPGRVCEAHPRGAHTEG